jgi:hypothetical protein
LQFKHDWAVRPDLVRRYLGSGTEVLLLVEPQAKVDNYDDLAKEGFDLVTIYSTPKVADGGEYMVQRIEAAAQPSPAAR